MTRTLSFRLPLPLSKNEIDGVHAMAGVQQVNASKRAIWVSACGQHRPSTSPPNMVRAYAFFCVGQRWDSGNLTTALYSIVFDALQRPPGGQPPGWRQGLAELKGFIVDDSDRHLVMPFRPQQKVEPNRRRRFLHLTLEWEEESAA